MQSEPMKEHEWLNQFVGEWTYESEATMPTGETETFSGTECVRSLGGLWIVGEGKGEMPGGGEAQVITTVGYDPEKKKYVGTFIGSMMTNLWIYEGEVEASGKTLSLYADGPNMAEEGKTARYRDSVEFVSDDHRVLTSSVQTEDGNWQTFMTGHYRKVK